MDIARRMGKRFNPTRGCPPPPQLINIVYTSGTTGQPKGVMLTAANLEAVIRGILKALSIDEESRIFSSLPFSHTYGLSQL